MPFVSEDLLEAAAVNLAGRHPLTVISIPALLRAAKAESVPPTQLVAFGSAQEKVVLDSFKVRDGKKPYLAVWQDHPQLVNHDYPGSTLQRLRTQDILGRSIFIDDAGAGRAKRTKFGLRPEAGAALIAGQQPQVDKASLAVWLGRNVQIRDLAELLRWFDQEYPTAGTDLAQFYTDEVPASLGSVAVPFVESRAEDKALLRNPDSGRWSHVV